MNSLPKQFVVAMRTLFDIMDDKHTGYVKLTDIENRWRDDRTKGLPRGVIESLQKVASHDGLLTFERFCAGLKICLLQNQVEKASNNPEIFDTNVECQTTHLHLKNSKDTPLVPTLETYDIHAHNNKWNNNILKNGDGTEQQITTNVPQIIAHNELLEKGRKPVMPAFPDHDKFNEISCKLLGPPKPPRAEKNTEQKESKISYKIEETSHFQISDTNDKRSYTAIEGQSRGLGDGRPAADFVQAVPASRRGSRRREPRRHTLHNGVDYNLLKRMKQIEQEKDILVEGLRAVEEAREWYLKQLGEVQEKIRYTGRMGAYVVSKNLKIFSNSEKSDYCKKMKLFHYQFYFLIDVLYL